MIMRVLDPIAPTRDRNMTLGPRAQQITYAPLPSSPDTLPDCELMPAPKQPATRTGWLGAVLRQNIDLAQRRVQVTHYNNDTHQLGTS